MGRRDGTYEGDDGYAVRVREHGADRDGAARSEWHGVYPEKQARALAMRLAHERGGRVVQDEQHPGALDVVVGRRGGRPPHRPKISFRLPADLVDRLDAHAAATGTTRSELLRRGAVRILAEGTTTMTTTEYGTWANHGTYSATTVEGTVADRISGADADWRHRIEESGALNEMVADYRRAINNALPPDVSLNGNDFYGPHPSRRWDGYPVDDDGGLDVGAIIESVDLGAIVDAHDPDRA